MLLKNLKFSQFSLPSEPLEAPLLNYAHFNIWARTHLFSSPTLINNPVNCKNGEPLQPLCKLCFSRLDRVLLAHSPLHHHMKFITCYWTLLSSEESQFEQGEIFMTLAYKLKHQVLELTRIKEIISAITFWLSDNERTLFNSKVIYTRKESD